MSNSRNLRRDAVTRLFLDEQPQLGRNHERRTGLAQIKKLPRAELRILVPGIAGTVGMPDHGRDQFWSHFSVSRFATPLVRPTCGQWAAEGRPILLILVGMVALQIPTDRLSCVARGKASNTLTWYIMRTRELPAEDLLADFDRHSVQFFANNGGFWFKLSMWSFTCYLLKLVSNPAANLI
jgi:hypothetical protein